MASVQRGKPHAVCIPFPAQGHINPMLMMAKLLHHKGFHITFVNTVYIHNRLMKSSGAGCLQGLPDFVFEKIPDGLSATDTYTAQDLLALIQSVAEYFIIPIRELIRKLNNETPPVTCIVSDLSLPCGSFVAEEFGIPIALLLTASACGFASVAYYPELVERGLFPVKDGSNLTDGYLDTTIDFIPGMVGIRLRYLYSFFHTGDTDNIMVNFNLQKLKNAARANIIVANTFNALEHDVLEGLPATLPKVLPIGPLHLALNHVPKYSPVHSFSSSLWKDEPECIAWLSSRQDRSVLYVNYGSLTVLSPEQFLEFAWGLANSQHFFLWVVRPDMVTGGKAVLPPEFFEEIKGKGLLASWSPQEQVLNHPSVGGFLTHCGWNSTIETIGAGVPVICWPFFADQQTNCWFCCNKWGIGMEVNNNVKRDEVERLVRKLMEGDKAKDMRKRALEWKTLAEEAVGPDGSSRENFEKLVQVLQSKNAK